MPTGLKIPVGVNRSGRAAVETNESFNTKKLLELGLSEGGDFNPFQGLGLDDRLLFSIKTSAFRGRAIKAVSNIMAKYSQLVRMDESTIEFDEETEGEVHMTFKYIDLLTNKEEEFTAKFKRK